MLQMMEREVEAGKAWRNVLPQVDYGSLSLGIESEVVPMYKFASCLLSVQDYCLWDFKSHNPAKRDDHVESCVCHVHCHKHSKSTHESTRLYGGGRRE